MPSALAAPVPATLASTVAASESQILLERHISADSKHLSPTGPDIEAESLRAEG